LLDDTYFKPTKQQRQKNNKGINPTEIDNANTTAAHSICHHVKEIDSIPKEKLREHLQMKIASQFNNNKWLSIYQNIFFTGI
jgi:hypothetical protein